MTTTTQRTIESQCKAAFDVSAKLGTLSTQVKNDALLAMADAIRNNIPLILEANQRDIKNGIENGLSAALVDRLRLNEERMMGVASSVEEIAALKDPIGETLTGWKQPNGLEISKIRVPLGVISIIYEARPNVTVDAISLALKTGNAIVLRGSSSAYESNKALSDVMRTAAESVGIEGAAIQLLDDTSREGVQTLIKLDQYLNLVIPRGGAGLIQSVVKNATVPAIETGVGNCHVYVDKDADLDKALAIVLNAKTHRPSVCNSAESLLIHSDIASTFLPKCLLALSEAGVEIRGCETTQSLYPTAKAASDDDYRAEFLDLIMSVKVVSSLDEALEHITTYGSHHSEAIVSENITSVQSFIDHVDAAAVLINASTRFTDGGVFGFGAEMGISTQKTHARGPMGLPELTSYKYIVKGDGHIR
jgi:glutamate-5-semialdehyde dehydrogenase